jgi:hypothetical protein
MRQSRLRFAAAPLALLLTAGANEPFAPSYTADGSLVLPADYRAWVFLSSGLDMSYSEHPAMQGASMFDNVFVDPASWAAFKASGHWPDKTVFVMENRGADTKGSINKRGHYQTTELMGLEFHVRDEARFKGGWGFFAADGTSAGAAASAGASTAAAATLLPPAAPCYACHRAHGAVDTTFTQFYPTAKPIAQQAHTFRED